MKGIVGSVTVLVAMACALVMVGCEDLPTAQNASLGERGADGGFLWKPVSENDGRLVILLPAQYRGVVKSVAVKDSEGNTLEMGRFAGDVHNGGRPHFRFDKSGGAYGANIYTVADVGKLVHWPIPNGAARTEH